MQFSIQTNALLRIIQTVAMVIPSGSPALPILGSFLFELKNNVLTVIATDLQSSLEATLPVTSGKDGSCVVPAKILLDTLKALPNQEIFFKSNESTKAIEIKSEIGQYKITGDLDTDYPSLVSIEREKTISINGDKLRSAIDFTMSAISNDDLRPALTGMLMELGSKGIVYVSTDGHRLVKYHCMGDSYRKASMIVPRKPLNVLKSILAGQSNGPEDKVEVCVSSNHALFTVGSFNVYCRLIDESFPAYDFVIPKNNTIEVNIDTALFLSAIKRVSLYSDITNRMLKLSFENSKVTISAEDIAQTNSGIETLSCDHKGEPIEIGFNGKLITETLMSCKAKTVRISMRAPNSATLFTDPDMKENDSLLFLLMPVMVNPVS